MEEVSEHGSGCQSGWSMYLGPSSRLTKSSDKQEEEREQGERVDEEGDEGVSMVSDASSGPPQIHEAAQNDGGKRRRMEMNNPTQRKVSASCLDDTASSPFLNCSENASFNLSGDTTRSVCSDVEVSSEFSATYLKGRGKLCKPFPYTAGYGGEG